MKNQNKLKHNLNTEIQQITLDGLKDFIEFINDLDDMRNISEKRRII